MRSLLVALPIIVLALVLVVQALRGRPVSRPNLSVSVALLLLVYFIGTVGLGVFWVAQMALPKFDLHYLLGYCLTLLTLVHVLLQLRAVQAFFRRNSPAFLLTEDRRRFRPAVKTALVVCVSLLAIAPIVWALALEHSAPTKVVYVPKPAASEGRARVEMWIEHGSSRQTAIEYLYEQASRTRVRPLSRILHMLRLRRLPVTPEPPPCKTYAARAEVRLPTPRMYAGVTLHAALDRAARGGRYGDEAAPTTTSRDANVAERPVTPGSASEGASAEQRTLSLSAVTRESLADILHYANGVTGRAGGGSGMLLRAAPSAGARYPTDIYVAARDVDGVTPGIYYYHPRDHTLVPTGSPQALERLADSLPNPEAIRSAPLSFALGVTFDRTASKYGAHAYRYVTLDTGHVAANLALAAAASGLQCGREPLFDDQDLSRAMGIDLDDEGMLLVTPCVPQNTDGSSLRPHALTVPAHASFPLPADPDAADLTRLAHRLTSWRLRRDVPSGTFVPGPPTEFAASGIALARAPDAAFDVFEAIAQRRSFRAFAARSVSQEEFAGVLRDALGLATTVRGHRIIELYVAVRAVDGLKPGVYRYRPQAHALELIQLGDFSGTIERASYSQQVLGRAAFVLLWAMRTRLVEEPDGIRGFRHAHLDVGLAGENAYLSATARGLGVCGVGAFDDTEINGVIGGETHGDLVLFLIGVGHRS